MLLGVVRKSAFGENVRFVIGDEIGIENLEKCALVFSIFGTGGNQGYIGMFGPSRMNYSKVIPAIKYTKNLIQELSEAW